MINQDNLLLNNEKVLQERKNFPLLASHPGLAYFDNAATTQKPCAVLWALQNWYTNLNANPLRGMYELSALATAKYEHARSRVAAFLGAQSEEIVFTSGATMGLNLAALMLAERLQSGAQIVISEAEHHSNMLPWREAARRHQVEVVYAPLEEEHEEIVKEDGSL